MAIQTIPRPLRQSRSAFGEGTARGSTFTPVTVPPCCSDPHRCRRGIGHRPCIRAVELRGGVDLVAAGRASEPPSIPDLFREAAAGEQGGADVPEKDRAVMAAAARRPPVHRESLPERDLRRSGQGMRSDADDTEALAAGADLSGLEEEVDASGRPASAGRAVAEEVVAALLFAEAGEQGVEAFEAATASDADRRSRRPWPGMRLTPRPPCSPCS